VLARAVRMRVDTMLARNRMTAGVQTPPKLSVMVDYTERGSAVTQP